MENQTQKTNHSFFFIHFIFNFPHSFAQSANILLDFQRFVFIIFCIVGSFLMWLFEVFLFSVILFYFILFSFVSYADLFFLHSYNIIPLNKSSPTRIVHTTCSSSFFLSLYKKAKQATARTKMNSV